MTIFALEQAVSNGCQLDITEAESALEEVAALRTENERLRACFDWANGAAEEGWLPAQEVRKLRAQLAEAQRELVAKEAERAAMELERNNAQRQHTMQCAINTDLQTGVNNQ